MTDNVNLKIVMISASDSLREIEKWVNEELKGKNVLATQIVKGNVWIWWKGTPDQGYDGFRIVESSVE